MFVRFLCYVCSITFVRFLLVLLNGLDQSQMHMHIAYQLKKRIIEWNKFINSYSLVCLCFINIDIFPNENLLDI
jgi:hypothetical protein